MLETPRDVVTAALQEVCSGHADGGTPEQLVPVVYGELRRLAAAYLRRERPDHSLQATDLVHEAYLKLVDQTRVEWQGRTHFFAVAANAMRRILVDHARRRSRDKRGGGRERVTLHEDLRAVTSPECTLNDLISLDEAVTELAKDDPRQARIVEMRTFAGLTMAEIAEVLGVSKRTVEGEWTHALAWLRRRLAADGPR